MIKIGPCTDREQIFGVEFCGDRLLERRVFNSRDFFYALFEAGEGIVMKDLVDLPGDALVGKADQHPVLVLKAFVAIRLCQDPYRVGLVGIREAEDRFAGCGPLFGRVFAHMKDRHEARL